MDFETFDCSKISETALAIAYTDLYEKVTSDGYEPGGPGIYFFRDFDENSFFKSTHNEKYLRLMRAQALICLVKSIRALALFNLRYFSTVLKFLKPYKFLLMSIFVRSYRGP